MEIILKRGCNPSEVRLLVQIQRNGGWVTEKDITIKGQNHLAVSGLGGGGAAAAPVQHPDAQDDAGQHHRPAAEQNALVVIH